MDVKEEIFEKELKRTLEWLSKDPKVLTAINRSYSNEASPKEIIRTIDMLIEENLYIPLALYLLNEFVNYRGAELVKRILVDVLLSQWSKGTWDIAVEAMKKSITAHFEETKNFADY